MSVQYDRAKALATIQTIQTSTEQAIQEAYRQKSVEKMFLVYEAGYAQALKDVKDNSRG